MLVVGVDVEVVAVVPRLLVLALRKVLPPLTKTPKKPDRGDDEDERRVLFAVEEEDDVTGEPEPPRAKQLLLRKASEGG